MAEDLTEALGENVPLSEMIESLRQELRVAIEKGEGQDVAFEVQEAEVEVVFTATRGKEGEAGVKFWVVTAGGKASASKQTTHRLKLKLRPIDGRTGGAVKVSRSGRS